MNHLNALAQFRLIHLSRLYSSYQIDQDTFERAVMEHAQLFSFLGNKTQYYFVPQSQHFENQDQDNIKTDEDDTIKVQVKSEVCLKEESFDNGSTCSELSTMEVVEEKSETQIKKESPSKTNPDRTKKEKMDNYQERLRPRKPQEYNELIPHIQNIVLFLVRNLGSATPAEIEQEREKYRQNDILIQIFDNLKQKYEKSSKTKEDMVRFAVRRAITFLTDTNKTEDKPRVREASIAISRKYFSEKSEIDQIKTEADTTDDDYLALLPYKKNSINRTPSSDCISRLFSSPSFCEDYQLFLEHFEVIVETDNQNKIEKFIEFLVNCVRNNHIQNIGTYTRLPWTDAWFSSTKTIACEILAQNLQYQTSPSQSEKKRKTQ